MTIRRSPLALLCLAPCFLNAAELTVHVEGIFEADAWDLLSRFGSADPLLGLTIDIVVDDSVPGIVVLPAGMSIGSGGQVLTNDVTLIPWAAVTSAVANLGTYSWDVQDLETHGLFDSGHSYAVLIDGTVDDYVTNSISLSFFDTNLGEIVFDLECDETPCPAPNIGEAHDFLVNRAGDITIFAVSISSSADTEQTLASLQTMAHSWGMSGGPLKSVAEQLAAQDGDHAAAVRQLRAFIRQVAAQRDKRILGSDADEMIALAQALIDQIEG